jgi:DNA polymerase elongation subunit (family B)
MGITEMANICNVPATYIYTKGQQIKVFSQVYKYCYDHQIIVESNAYKSDGMEQYQGATVLEPKPGIYDNVVPFDFRSLYPTLMIAYNIDYSTLVKDGDTIPDELCNVIKWSEHVMCSHCEILDIKSDDYRCGEFSYKFLKEPKGVLPSIAEHLLNARANTRIQIKELKQTLTHLDKEHGEFKRIQSLIGILNKRQLSYKVSCNSLYGILGVGKDKGMIPCMPAAMSITAMGRKNLQKAAEQLHNKHNATIVYGDTDSAYTIFPGVPKEKLWELARKVEKEIDESGIFPAPMYLEFENAVYGQFLILSKKRYMWRDYNEDGTLSDKVGAKGVLLVRRDNSEFERTLYRTIVNKVFNYESFNSVLDCIITRLNECNSSSITFKDFVISKSVKNITEYKIKPLPLDPTKKQKRLDDLNCTENEYALKCLPAHVQLADRERSRGIRIDDGQRIDYLVSNMGKVDGKLFNKLEDPEYQQQYSQIIGIEYLYYVRKVTTPLDELLGIIYKDDMNIQNINTTYTYTPTWDKILRKARKTYIQNGTRKTRYIESQYKLRLTKNKVLCQLKSLFIPKIRFIEQVPPKLNFI